MKHSSTRLARSGYALRGGLVLTLALLTVLVAVPDLFAQKIRLDEKAAHGVSQTYHQGKYYMAWAGLSNRLYIMQSDDGVDWRAKVALDESSSHAPDIASDGAYLYMVWVGETSNDLYVIRSRDGVDWGNKVRLNERSNARPAIVGTDDGRLLIAWKGESSDKLHIMRSRDGVDWSAKVVLDEKTFNGPTLAAYDGDYYMVWTGVSNNDVYVMRSQEGVDWRAKVRLDERSRKAPSLASFDGKLYMAWVGDDRGDIYVMESRDGVDWRSKQRLDEQTLKSLKLTGGHKLAIAFQGATSDNIYMLMIRERTLVNGNIRGRVIDRDTGNPIAAALVATSSVDAETSAGGRYDLGEIRAGRVVVRASMPGYRSDEATVDLVAGETVEVDFALQRDIKEELKATGRATLRGLLFDFDKATIRPESEETLMIVLSILKEDPNAEFTIEGHTDADGSDEYNRDLSQRRAQAVVDWLVDRNISRRRLDARGYGEARPVADNDTETGRALNRRVEIVQKN